MELYKFHLFFLLIGQKRIIVKIAITDNVCGDFLCKVRLACAGGTSEN